MREIDENLIARRSGAPPPVGGFIHDAATVSRTVPTPLHPAPPIDRAQ